MEKGADKEFLLSIFMILFSILSITAFAITKGSILFFVFATITIIIGLYFSFIVSSPKKKTKRKR
ncbi:MAG: hypothetical protein QXL16_01665 [Candidatus Micrarchaeaceae archaeon]